MSDERELRQRRFPCPKLIMHNSLNVYAECDNEIGNKLNEQSTINT